MVKILDGRKVQNIIAARLAVRISKFKKIPTLVIIQAGDREDSNVYIRQKKLFGEKIGVSIVQKKFPDKVSEKAIISVIEKYNKDKNIDGIIVQLPLPKHLNRWAISGAINPEKDVDGLTAKNVAGLLAGEKNCFVPATTRGIFELLEHYKISATGKRVAVVGRSVLVGKPTAMALINRGATVTVCHSKTRNLNEETKRAEILIVAAGKPGLISKKHVSRGQIVIDVGINRLKGKLVGDVDFAGVKKIVRAITPVPGGIGPLTVASLFSNLLDACSRRK